MRKTELRPSRRKSPFWRWMTIVIMTITLQSYFQSSGYHVDIENDPNKAVERVRECIIMTFCCWTF